MESFLTDLKQALRMFRLSPGFTITALAALALGVGTNTAVFSVLNAVLLRPVSAPEPDRVVAFLTSNPGGSDGLFASEMKFNVWRDQTSVLEDISAYSTGWFNLTGVDHPQTANTAFVTLDYFRLFGLSLSRGRYFTAEEERPHATNVVILSNTLWENVFGRDPDIIGKTIWLSGSPFEVIGVLAAAAQTETSTPFDLWMPFPIDPNSANQLHYFRVIGRLKPGVTLTMANAQMQLATQVFRRTFPNALSTGRGDVFSVEPLRDALVSNVRKSLIVLAVAVSFVLLIACANVANLLLARAGARRHEIAIRAAVGAGRVRIVRQLLTESGVLALAGAALGLGLGLIGIRTILTLGASRLPRIGVHASNVTLDWRVLLFTVLVTLITGLLFGLVPALQASRVDLNTSLKATGARHSGGNRTPSLLIIGEVSVALVLLIGAVLLIRTLIALRSVDPGFDQRDVVTTMVTLDPRFAKTSDVHQIGQNIVQRLNALPGVVDSALTGLLPLEGSSNSVPITIIGRPLTDPTHGDGRFETVSPGYFDILKIPLIRGRLFTEADGRDAEPVAIINRAMARQFWPDGDPLQDRLDVARGLAPGLGEPVRRIVGVVGDVRTDALNQNPNPAVYVPSTQRANTITSDPRSIWKSWVIVRTHGHSLSLDSAIERELRGATGGLPVSPVRRMEEIVARSTASQNFNMVLMSIFGGCSLLLAAIGIYGLLANSVQQRVREMEIRIALGARPADVRKMVVFQGMRLTLIGAAAGTCAAIGLTRFIQSFLFGVKALDPVTFLLVPILLISVALLAAWVPARRASSVDLADALRSE